MKKLEIALTFTLVMVFVAIIGCLMMYEVNPTSAVVGPASGQPEASLPTVDNIMSWQRQLKELGYYDGPVDGEYGGSTKTAVEAWQSAQFCKRCLTIEVKQK